MRVRARGIINGGSCRVAFRIWPGRERVGIRATTNRSGSFAGEKARGRESKGERPDLHGARTITDKCRYLGGETLPVSLRSALARVSRRNPTSDVAATRYLGKNRRAIVRPLRGVEVSAIEWRKCVAVRTGLPCAQTRLASRPERETSDQR